MKKMLTGLIGLLASVFCHAQIMPEKQTDTLIVTSLRYNEEAVEKEDWPLDVLYKTKSEFTIGDKKYNITEVNKWGRTTHYSIVDTKDRKGLPLDLWMTTGNLRNFTIILFNGYEFSCSSSKFIPVERYLSQPCVISHSLEGRETVKMEFPEFKCHGEGEVYVMVKVAPSGKVVATKIIDNISASNRCLRLFARRSASMSSFSPSDEADGIQIGEIIYRFDEDKSSFK